MIVYLKRSQELKNDYKDYLHNKEQVGLKIDSRVFEGLPLYLNKFYLDSTDTLAIKEVNYQCSNQSDNTPDFDVIFNFYPKKKILAVSVMTILEKPGYRTGYYFSTQLQEDGQLGPMKISTIQE